MKHLTIIIFLVIGSLSANAQTQDPTRDPSKKVEAVKASCAKCKFGYNMEECTLAIRHKGKVYIVEGTTIDDHGDAHAKNGFCNAVRKAEVQGEVVDKKYKVSYFKLLD